VKNPFRLAKIEIDGIRKAKKPEIFAKNFSVEVVFEKTPLDIDIV